VPAFGFLANASFTNIKSASSATTEPVFIFEALRRRKKKPAKTNHSGFTHFTGIKTALSFIILFRYFPPIR